MEPAYGVQVLPENPVMVGIGVLLMLLARFSRSAVGPFGGKPVRPVTLTERLILLFFGLFAFVLGLVRMIQR